MAKNITPEFNIHVMNGHGEVTLVVYSQAVKYLFHKTSKVLEDLNIRDHLSLCVLSVFALNHYSKNSQYGGINTPLFESLESKVLKFQVFSGSKDNIIVPYACDTSNGYDVDLKIYSTIESLYGNRNEAGYFLEEADVRVLDFMAEKINNHVAYELSTGTRGLYVEKLTLLDSLNKYFEGLALRDPFILKDDFFESSFRESEPFLIKQEEENLLQDVIRGIAKKDNVFKKIFDKSQDVDLALEF